MAMVPIHRLPRGPVFGVLLCGLLSAQTPLTDAEEQRRRAQEEAEQRARVQQAPNVHLQDLTAATEAEGTLDLPSESPSFRIDRVVLEAPAWAPAGLRALVENRQPGAPFGFAQAYLDQYAGRRIGPEGLKLIMSRLTRRILARGYTTSQVDLPEQDLSTGTLTLWLIPGFIGAIRCTDPTLGTTWRSAFPARPGDLLNIRDLEQGLEQMKRVPSQDVAIAIAPGTTPGESEVVLTILRGKPWRVTVNLDDSGLPATGQWQGSLGAAWDHPLGGSDLFNVSLNHDLTPCRKGSGTQGGSLSYSVPLGYWTFGASWSQSEYDQRIAGRQKDLHFSGLAQNLEFRAGYLFYRDQTWKDTIQLRTGHRNSWSYLNGTELDVQRRNNSFAELSLLHSQALGRAQLDLAVGLRRGVSWFGAQADLDPGGYRGPTFYYRLQTLDATLALPMTFGGYRLHYTGTLHGQKTFNTLYATEYVSIGNRWTVRGVEGDRTLASEGGGFFRQDLEGSFVRGYSWYLGLDAGRVNGSNQQALAGRSLAGMVLGLKGVIKERLNFNLFMGGALHQPASFRNPWPILGFNASCQF